MYPDLTGGAGRTPAVVAGLATVMAEGDAGVSALPESKLTMREYVSQLAYTVRLAITGVVAVKDVPAPLVCVNHPPKIYPVRAGAEGSDPVVVAGLATVNDAVPGGVVAESA